MVNSYNKSISLFLQRVTVENIVSFKFLRSAFLLTSSDRFEFFLCVLFKHCYLIFFFGYNSFNNLETLKVAP